MGERERGVDQVEINPAGGREIRDGCLQRRQAKEPGRWAMGDGR